MRRTSITITRISDVFCTFVRLLCHAITHKVSAKSSVPDSQLPTSQEDPEYTYLLSLSSGRDEDSSSRASGSQPKTPSKWSVSQRTDSSSLLNFSRLTLPQGAQPAPARSDLSTSIMSNTKARQKDDASFTEDSWPSVPGLSSSSDNLGLISSCRSVKLST